MSYYKDNHEDLRSTGETCRFVKNDNQRRSFTESVRNKFKQIRVVSQPLGRGYMVTIEKIEERNPAVKGSKYAFHYDDLIEKGHTIFETTSENKARSFYYSVKEKMKSVGEVQINRMYDDEFIIIHVRLLDVKKTG